MVLRYFSITAKLNKLTMLFYLPRCVWVMAFHLILTSIAEEGKMAILLTGTLKNEKLLFE